jgi:phosphoribosylanthranilate isomerase
LTKVKICGLKREEDILYVNKLKPDYVGFVFAESIRKVDKYRAKELTGGLDRSIKKVGVFLNESMEKVNEIADYCGLDVLQFHGDENPKYCNSFQHEIWKAFRIKDIHSLNEFERYNVDGFLLDTYIKGEYGGTGKTFIGKW